MKKPDSSHLETLEALLAEKRKHEGYLAKLEERRAGTPEHVFARLRDEYLTKLTDAQVRAAAEAEALSGGLAEDEEAVQEAEARLAELEEEKVEGELRAAVGEFEGKEWQKKLTALNASIALAEKECDARRSVFERTRALLAEARGTMAPGDATADIAPAPEGPSAPPEGHPKLRHTTAMSSGPNFDELAFLNSVVPRQSTPTRPIREGGSAPPPKPIAGTAPAAKREAEMPAQAVAAKAAPAAEAKTEAEPERAAAPAPPEGQAPPEAAETSPPAEQASPESAPELALQAPDEREAEPVAEEPASAPEDESAPSPLGKPNPRNTQTIKSLKCQECGSMNYPTEWYCERCGGELAAL